MTGILECLHLTCNQNKYIGGWGHENRYFRCWRAAHGMCDDLEIVPAGTDTYMISAANDTCGNCTPPEIRVTEQATAYCAKQSKAMTVKDTKDSTFDIGFGKRVTLTFECK